MKFSSREDIEAPIDDVFASVTDFDGFERLILRRGGKIERTDGLGKTGVGMCWDLGFKFRGRKREAEAEVVHFQPSEEMKIESVSGGILMYLDVTLVPLSPKRTRMLISLDLKPKTMSARLLLQSMKLAKGTLTTKFKARVTDFAEDIESRYKAAA